MVVAMASPSDMNLPEIMDAGYLAELFGVTPRRIRDWWRDGKLGCFHVTPYKCYSTRADVLEVVERGRGGQGV